MLAPAADAAQEQGARQRPRQENQGIPVVGHEPEVVRRRSNMRRRQVQRPPGRVNGVAPNLPLALGVAEERQRRQEHGCGKQEVLHPRIKGLERQPEVNPDAAVSPHDQQQDRLEEPGRRRRGKFVELLGVSLVGPEQAERDARAEDMVGEQERDRQAESELGGLHPGPAELAALVERPEAEAQVGQERAVEQDRAGRRLPDELLQRQPSFHRRDGDIPQCVIGIMKRDIGKQDQPAGQTQPTKAEREFAP